jgi:magnesium chelatase subunit D
MKERIFAPQQMESDTIPIAFDRASLPGNSQGGKIEFSGSVIGTRRTEVPTEIDLRATLSHAIAETGVSHLRLSNMHEKVRRPKIGVRYLFVIDSSGSHAAQEKMRLVKGAATSLLRRLFKRDDEIAIIVFRGTSAQVLLEPSRIMEDAIAALEYLPTGGRTPLAHALDLAKTYITPTTLLILLTDGRANIALRTGDAWQDALEVATQIHCKALLIDTENSAEPLGRSRQLVDVLGASYVTLDNFKSGNELDLRVAT